VYEKKKIFNYVNNNFIHIVSMGWIRCRYFFSR